MAAKRIRTSLDGTTWYTLPGNSGELRDEAGQLADTIFGQSFASSESGLIMSNLTANGLFKGFAGYEATLKQPSGASITGTTLATTLVGTRRYQITDATKRMLDRTATTNVFDATVNHNADVEWIDFLHGIVKFKDTYTVNTPVTITCKYFATASIAKARSFTLGMTSDVIDTSDFDTVQGNSGLRTFDYGLKHSSLEIGGVYATSNAFRTALIGRAETIVEVAPDGANGNLTVFRMFAKYVTRAQRGNVGALEEETLNFQLSVPDQALLRAPAGWDFRTGTTLSLAIQNAITQFFAGSLLYVQYLPNGTDGWQGQMVVTDISLKGGIEAMNDFTVSGRITAGLTAVTGQ